MVFLNHCFWNHLHKTTRRYHSQNRKLSPKPCLRSILGSEQSVFVCFLIAYLVVQPHLHAHEISDRNATDCDWKSSRPVEFHLITSRTSPFSVGPVRPPRRKVMFLSSWVFVCLWTYSGKTDTMICFKKVNIVVIFIDFRYQVTQFNVGDNVWGRRDVNYLTRHFLENCTPCFGHEFKTKSLLCRFGLEFVTWRTLEDILSNRVSDDVFTLAQNNFSTTNGFKVKLSFCVLSYLSLVKIVWHFVFLGKIQIWRSYFGKIRVCKSNLLPYRIVLWKIF